MAELNPEQRAREQIDTQLSACGWVVQSYKQYNPSAGRGIALREVPLKSGSCDYLLLVEFEADGANFPHRRRCYAVYTGPVKTRIWLHKMRVRRLDC